MWTKLVPVCIFLSNFALNTYGANFLQQLEKIFQDEENNERENALSYRPHRPRHHQRKKTLETYSNPNLLNIQTLNLYGKPTKREREDEDFNRFLRTETERICEETGRCGCSGGRCGDMNEDETANEVDQLVRDINGQLAVEDKNNNRPVNELKDDRVDLDKDDDDDDDDDLLRGKKVKLNDDVDVVVLNPNEVDQLLRKQDFLDLTRNSVILDTDTGKFSSGPKNQDHLRDIVAELMKSDQSHKRPKNSDDVTPEELFRYYTTLKNQVVNLITFYIRNKQNKIPIEEHLSFRQLQNLENLKVKYERGLIKENDIKSEVVRTIFGEGSGTKVLPHTKNSRNIYVPKNHFEDILNLREINLRSQKRILPLTGQQKKRMQNKDKAKIIPKFVWRRNAVYDQNHGVPFNLNLHGLGQINPN